MSIRRCLTLGGVLVVALCVSASHVAAQGPTATGVVPVSRQLQRGEYERIVFELATAQALVTAEQADALVHALTELGRPAEAVERAAAWRGDPRVAPAFAKALETQGQRKAATDAWTIALRGADSVRARVERLRLERESGEVEAADAALVSLLTTLNARGGTRSAGELHAMAIAARLLGRTDPTRFREALRLYDAALALDSMRLDARAELGAMFLEKFNYADARTTLTRVIAVNPRHPGALATLTRLYAADSRSDATDPLLTLLAVNPRSADGRALAARRLIDAEQPDAAVVEARKGLVVDSTAANPWIAIAAAHWLTRDTLAHRNALEQAHARLRGSARAEVELAEVSARNRLYADAVRFARAGTTRDPKDARTAALLGINLLRTGSIAEGRTMLERAFALDPFDVWAKNTLDLLDTYAQARTATTEHFDLVIEQNDADLMALHAAPLAEEAYTALTTRYGFVPPERVRVEFFRSHADFSVRAIGLAGLGALGVAFGNVLAIDEPPARERGEFNWAAVLWHEFAHTITLGLTQNRVPRWVSEGLSVHEERRARAAWGGGVTPTLIAAYGAGRLQPVSRLNDGFVHPRYAQEVTLSYALSAYVFEMLEERNGIAGIRALLAGYRDGGNTSELMQRVYGLVPAQLDSTFDRWFRLKFAREFAAVPVQRAADLITESGAPGGPLRDALTTAASAAERKDWPRVVESATRAVRLFPGWAERGSGYHLLAAAHTATGNVAGAREALEAITTRNGEAIDENLALAGLLEAAYDTVGAIAALERAAQIDPFDAAVQSRLGTLAFAARAWPVAVRARRAVVALQPTDRADALYRLAQVLVAAGDLTAGRREVLRALDIAPDFEAAQDLLLAIRSTGTP